MVGIVRGVSGDGNLGCGEKVLVVRKDSVGEKEREWNWPLAMKRNKSSE